VGVLWTFYRVNDVIDSPKNIGDGDGSRTPM
jgi:hypothetical protein